MTAPTVTVEIAFTSTFSTPEGSRVWTDVTQYVDVDQVTLAIAIGRTDERTVADANNLTVAFDNKDGRFTPEKTTGAYYPNVKLYRPVRVTTQYSGGTARQRYLGYARSWPPAWGGGSDATAQVVLSAVSRMQRLGIADPLRSVIEEEILLDKPVVYYTLGDPDGTTTASDSSGNAAGSFASNFAAAGSGAAVVFGTATGPTTDSLTAAQFANGQYLRATNLPIFTVAGFFSTTGVNADIVLLTAPGLGTLQNIHIDGSGKLHGIALGGVDIATAASVADGATHHFAFVLSDPFAPTWTLYVDGASVGSAAGSSVLALTASEARLGSGFTGTIAHFAILPFLLSPTRVAAHAAAGLTGFAGESTAARLARYAAWRGIPAAEVDAIGTSRSAMHFDPTGMALLDAMRVLEQTESGVLCDSPAGHLRLIGEAGRYVAASAFTLDLAQQYVTTDFVPQYDDAQLINDVTITNVGNQSTGRYVNQTSVDSYGRTANTSQTASTYSEATTDDARWIVARYAEPATRLQSVTIAMHSLAAGDAALREAIMAADIATLITITNLPAQFAGSSGTWFIEGWSEQYGPGTHYVTFNLSPSAAYVSTFILDDPVRGLLDSAYTLGH